ncbi:MAG: hypothetical protein EA376_05410 [Phycisphaeraceae bacterium]|nr:MAG: hypothetical protein EA376_05410 [Phycisphaeraceae bacterium]
MSHAVLRRGFASAAVIAAAGSLSANATIITDLTVQDELDVLVGLVPLDLSSIVSTVGGPSNNVFSTTFSSTTPGAFTGALTATVYGNVGAPGSSLTDIAIIYTFVGDGPSGIDDFEFGVDSGASLDFDDVLRGTHGTIVDATTIGQASPVVSLGLDGSNSTLTFDFSSAGDPLGGFDSPNPVSETFSWYIRNDAAVQINLVDVVVTDFSAATTQTLAFTNIPGQPDIGVPAPGAVALFGLGFAVASRRRR